jgi:hypothetical protein
MKSDNFLNLTRVSKDDSDRRAEREQELEKQLIKGELKHLVIPLRLIS